MRILYGVILLVSLGVIVLTSRTETAKAAMRPLLLVANKGDQTVGIIDPEAEREVATIAEGGVTGHELVASPDGRFAYVPIYGNSGVGMPGTDGRNMVVIDVAARKVIGNVDFGHGVRPHCAIWNPKDGLLYVTTELDHAISIIDPRTLKIVGSIPTGQPESHMLAISHDGRRGYTANVGPGTVSVLDIPARKLITVISVSPQVQRISVSMDDKLVFTSDQASPRLAVIDTSTNQVKTSVALPGTGYGTAPTPDGRWLLVCVPGANEVAVVDLSAMKVARTIAVPAAPQEVLMRPDGKVAYVSCDASRKVAAIHLSDWTVEKLIDAGTSVDGLAWAE
jgi:DNA-binding beta-propeller fold protein YncE